jgi:glycosyltransferase involved in cell wall biosynthesis
LEQFSSGKSAFPFRYDHVLAHADIVNLHWISGLIDIPTFFRNMPLPVVWTLHDMNPFTGGCHYDLGCSRYVERCGSCPQLGSKSEIDLSRKVWLLKNRIYQHACQKRLHVVVPSRWLGNEAGRSSLFSEAPITLIPNGVDVNVFDQYDSTGIRDVFGISRSDKVVLFLADSVSNRRKGFSDLIRGLREAQGTRDVKLVSVGRGRQRFDADRTHIHLGPIENEGLLALVFNLARVFVIPSHQDNLPNTVLEALACGTPVVGYRVGGIPEAITDGCNGLLVSPGKADGLWRSVSKVLDDDEMHRRMSRDARRIAVSRFSLERQALAYSELYGSIVKADNQQQYRGRENRGARS